MHRLPFGFSVLVAAVLIGLVSRGRDGPAVQAATLSVCPAGCPYTRVQAAIDAAATGATILIAPGIYPARLTIRGKTLTLQGAGSDVTVLDGEHVGRVLFVAWDATVTLRALSVRHGRATDAAVPRGEGGGIFIATGGTLTISESAITGNTAAGQRGGGIANRGMLTISQSQISGNTAQGSGGGIFNSRRLRIDTSSISGNHSLRSGGGIYTTDRLSVARSLITDNTAEAAGGGIFNDGAVGDAGVVELRQVMLRNNAARRAGGGLYNHEGGALAVSQSTLAENQAGGRGGGLYADSDSTIATAGVTLTESMLSHNQTGDRGGGLYRASGPLRLVRTVVRDNQPDDCAPSGYTCP
jgi:predicted outer membrane repeat protein